MFTSFIHTVIAVIASAFVAFSSVPSQVRNLQGDLGVIQRQLEVRLGSATPIQAQKFRLAGAGITSSATSIVLQSFKLPDASTTIAMADLGTIAYGTLEPGTSKEEQISFTGVSQNGDGTATLTGVTRGLDFRASSCAETSANKKSHAGGSYFILSNTACFYTQYPGKGNTESISGAWSFATSNIPRLNGQGTWGVGTEEYFVTKRYADALAIAGSPDGSQSAKGIFEEATQAELAAGTQTGGTSADLVAPARYFNATQSATTTVPVTNSSGKLAQGFLDLTQAFSFSGGLTSTATTTLSGASTFSTSTFSVIPTLPSSNPTADDQAARKAYVDISTPNFIDSSGMATTTTTSTSNDALKVYSFTLTKAQRVMVSAYGSFYNTNANNQAVLALKVDSGSAVDVARATSVTGGEQHSNSAGFTYVTSQLAVGAHTITIYGRVPSGMGGTATYTNTFVNLLGLGN